jgi:lysophospholipase L1-like esterase
MAFGRIALGAAAAGFATQFIRARNGYPWFDDLDPSGEFGDPDRPQVDIVILGDSTITGNGLHEPDEIWIRQLMPKLTADYRIRVVSLATGGVKVGQVVEDQLSRALMERWDVAILSAGANDAIRAGFGPVVETQLSRIVDALLDVSARVILLGVGDLGSSPRALFPFDHLLRYRGKALDRVHFRIAADRERVYKVPMWERSAAEFNARNDIWAADQFHPNRVGHAIWAKAIYPTLSATIDEVVADR